MTSVRIRLAAARGHKFLEETLRAKREGGKAPESAVAGDADRVVPFEEAMACPKVACECHPGGRRMRKLGARVLLWGDSYAATDTAAWLAAVLDPDEAVRSRTLVGGTAPTAVLASLASALARVKGGP